METGESAEHQNGKSIIVSALEIRDLKQHAPRNQVIQCYVKRDKAKSTYHLFLGLDTDKGKFLLSARKIRRLTCAEIIISSDEEDISHNSISYMGKLRSNFWESKYTIYDNQPPYNGGMSSRGSPSRGFYSRTVLPNVPYRSDSIAQVSYQVKMYESRGPRRISCTMHSIPTSVLQSNDTVPSYPHLPCYLEDIFSGKETPLILKNKAPRWDEQLQLFGLNFRGRVTVASVKNFQMIAAQGEQSDNSGTRSSQAAGYGKPEEIILQFGKISENLFTMDYRYPLSAFQAFGICLSSFGTKLACE